jgi:hypothetical protein
MQSQHPGRSINRRTALTALGLVGAAVAAGCGTPNIQSPDPTASDAVATDAVPKDAVGRPPLPDRVVSMWMFDWRHPSIGDLPPDVHDTVNMLVVAMAQSEVAGTGRVKWSPHRDATPEMARQIGEAIGRGAPVLLGVGGHNDGGITVTDRTQVAEFCDSIRGLVDRFGFTGVDLDLEPSGSRWTQPALAEIARRLKAEYGPTFLVGITAALYGEHTARWLALADEIADDYDFFAHMLYDYVEATDERLTLDTLDKIRTAAQGGVPSAKQVLGFMCNTTTFSSPVALTGQVWAAALAEFPDLRGTFIWESSIEHGVGYEWTRSVGRAVAGS